MPTLPGGPGEGLCVGGVPIPGRFFLAPMVGYTHLPFRQIAREMGAALVSTEMISAEALVRRHPKALDLLRLDPSERPISVQLMGKEPAALAEAARIAEASGADLIDLNCGCPVRRVVEGGAGARLLLLPELAGRLVRAMRGAVGCPITVKMRTGWDSQGPAEAQRFARAVEENGAAAVAVHGRSRKDLFRGEVDLEAVARIKASLRVPVIGNGGVAGVRDSVRMFRETGCDAIMLARGAVGNPWLFARLRGFFEWGELAPPPGLRERLRVALDHLERLRLLFGEGRAVKEGRKHMVAYTKGLPGSAAFREALTRMESYRELALSLRDLFARARGRSPIGRLRECGSSVPGGEG
ncbi:MAG: tRNA dihydrouridine synthase DusB [Nitrospinota bacterium]